MTSLGLFRNSIATAALTAALVAAPIAAHAQDNTAPPADQYQYTPQQNQYAPQQDTSVQNGAPQGIQQAPPAIPDYAQPQAPGDGYIWTPGYWAWSGYGYEWVQGAWVAAPYTGALWTPGYWGFAPYGYFWNAGYWGPYVGYYGGINYGFGYFGVGFYGGYWGGGRFWYNSYYSHVGIGFHNVYNRPYNGFNGRPGGASFVRTNATAGYRGTSNSFRGSTINGQNRGFSNARPSTLNNRAVGSAPQARNFAQSPQTRGYAQSPNAGRSYAAPAAPHNFSSGGSSGFHGGGGFSGGGGGGFHGGGGGGGHAGGGGGHR